MTAQSSSTSLIDFDNSYARLPDRFYSRVAPSPVTAPRLIRVNERLAQDLNHTVRQLLTDGLPVFSGNAVEPGSTPLAMAYAGHQFGNFVPELGDGRAILLGEVLDQHGKRYDIQLKGSGLTPYSRRGDGRAALGPVLREYVLSEAFAALGIPATGALAAVVTGDYVMRDPPAPGAILTRVAASHIRVGTFQYFAARSDKDAIRVLAGYVIARHYPEAAQADNRFAALLDLVIARQASLIAQWMHVGFIHGVMNTDNMSIAGETIDFGPCAFIDSYHPGTVYSSIDHRGRYAYANQPRIAQWNLTRFAETLLPLLAEEQEAAVGVAQEAVNRFGVCYEAAYETGLRAKLGLGRAEAGDAALGLDLLQIMADSDADFTLTFRGLCDAAGSQEGLSAVRSLFANATAFDAWAERWRQRLADEGGDAGQRRDVMRRVNPAFIPRNHLVEEVIRAAVDQDDFAPFENLLEVLATPFDDQPDNARYAAPPTPDQVVHQTFCGT